VIPNYDVAPDSGVASLCQNIHQVLDDPQKNVYIHCRAGIGRTGTVSGCLLSEVYPIDGEEALERVQAYYNCRVSAVGRCPETPEQIQQVKRVTEIFKEEKSKKSE
jgi:metal-sulfur cluster biosynthetic enzyme